MRKLTISFCPVNTEKSSIKLSKIICYQAINVKLKLTLSVQR